MSALDPKPENQPGAGDQPADAEWALPADAAVAAGAEEPSATSSGQGAGPSGAGGGSPLDAVLRHPKVQERPELAVAGAFAGAFLLARILRRLSE